MNTRMMAAVICLMFALLATSGAQAAEWRDRSPHRVRFVTVEEGVRLEVLDWGGKGPPLVLLPGLGNTAHVFDDFALKLKPDFHVYAITRRGFGASSVPQEGYSTDRLADDVRVVLDELGLQQPVLAGHSVAGLELSSLAERIPERLAGLVYLDPTVIFEADDPELLGVSEWGRSLQALRNRLDVLERTQFDPTPIARELMNKDWPAFAANLETMMLSYEAIPPFETPTGAATASYSSLKAWYARTRRMDLPEAELRATFAADPATQAITVQRAPQRVGAAIQAGKQKRTNTRVPALAIFAIRNQPKPVAVETADTRTAEQAYSKVQTLRTERRVDAFKRDVPDARIVLVQRGEHHVYFSNEEEVLKEIRAFASRPLPHERSSKH